MRTFGGRLIPARIREEDPRRGGRIALLQKKPEHDTTDKSKARQFNYRKQIELSKANGRQQGPQCYLFPAFSAFVPGHRRLAGASRGY